MACKARRPLLACLSVGTTCGGSMFSFKGALGSSSKGTQLVKDQDS